MEEFIPRNYQIQLMEIALKKNTIIFLPTGSGKTFIALMTLKQLSEPLKRKYSENGKISILLVNTVALVDQHAKYLEKHTDFSVGKYTGEMNLDFWPRDLWYEEYDKHQVLIMTSQILYNIVASNFIDLNKINLLIFDECHHGVSDHPMRQLMMQFQNLHEPPRVLGLTATLLNGNCKTSKVMEEVQLLETTFHGKVATVDGLEEIVGYSTNPCENFVLFETHLVGDCESHGIAYLQNIKLVLANVKILKQPKPQTLNLPKLEPEDDIKKLLKLLEGCCLHIQMLGLYGGYLTSIAYMIQVERLKKGCDDFDTCQLLSCIICTLSYIKKYFEKCMKNDVGRNKIIKHSSSKVRELIKTLEEFKEKSTEELCGIIFVRERFTAKIVHHILRSLSEVDKGFAIKSDFMVGYQNNPYNSTRESLYLTKKNRQVLESFSNKEINIICSSNVLEEGVDIPKCTLVIKFDKSEDYRSYIQSKGRARHKSSRYYTLVEKSNMEKYIRKYTQFKEVEETLNNYLIGKNTSRSEPADGELDKMYNEAKLPPYYVNGVNSASVNMTTAIALVCQYCQSLPCDKYTEYAPEWYLDMKDNRYKVFISLPTISTVLDVIEGEWMSTKKDAKRAAALKACILLHKMGQLDDHLLPKKHEVTEEDVQFLFTHYPPVKEKNAGNSKMKRLHKKQILDYLTKDIEANQTVYLHIINLKPAFDKCEEINERTMYEMYSSDLCFGFISANRLPVICDFPIYVTSGMINVNINVNASQIELTGEDIIDLKKFHYLIFKDVLEILKSFLVFATSNNAEKFIIVPVDKINNNIDFHVVRNYNNIKPKYGDLSLEEKLRLNITQETYLKKIVTPSYRNEFTYLVTEVSLNKTPVSPFPNDAYGTFLDYYQEKHQINIHRRDQPLLLVKSIARKMNFIKPRGQSSKKRKQYRCEEGIEYLIPELLIKQEFPSVLWIQSYFLPTILSRVVFLLQVEDLRSRVASETGLGRVRVNNCKPLEVDTYLLDYEPVIDNNPREKLILTGVDETDTCLVPTAKLFNKDFKDKVLEAEYPWKNIDEPKDIERELNITLMDIDYYEQFINEEISDTERTRKNDFNPNKLPAITYDIPYSKKSIKLLNNKFTGQGPEQCDIYKALTTAKANDIVNLERLETLGDSFLKLISSVYISLRFPKFSEGQATSLKGRMVSNKSLYYLAKKKNLGGIMKYSELAAKEEWVPPGFEVPEKIMNDILSRKKNIGLLFAVDITEEEQLSGTLSMRTLESIETAAPMDDFNQEDMESCLHSCSQFLKHNFVGDKHVSDVVESLLGLFFEKCGFEGAVKLVEWFGIIPPSERFLSILRTSLINPVLSKTAVQRDIDFQIPQWENIEKRLGYKFNNRGYLLQALTHSSYTTNRITNSYETLEFLGDAVLDFLITCFIYESCGNLNPGELTDLRSALVNNNTFASLVVRNGFHKYLLMMNSYLQTQIDHFTNFFALKNYVIDDEIIILLDEDDINIAECVDVPKVLGDIFESLAGAVYLDSGKNLATVWEVFYKLMYVEITTFSANVPKNVIRRLYETVGLYPMFSEPFPTNNKCIVALQYMLNGRKKTVHGFGSNKNMAKKAAAKIALRSLNK